MSFGSGAAHGQDEDYLYGDNSPSNPLIDFFEDNMLEEVGSSHSQSDDSFEMISGKKNNQADRQQTTSQSDGEDLGIIDLDNQEGSEYDDDFD